MGRRHECPREVDLLQLPLAQGFQRLVEDVTFNIQAVSMCKDRLSKTLA